MKLKTRALLIIVLASILLIACISLITTAVLPATLFIISISALTWLAINSFLIKPIENNPVNQQTRNETTAAVKEEHMQLFHAHDKNASLPDGIFFNEILNKAINHVKRRKLVLAVLLIDIDTEKKNIVQKDPILDEAASRFKKVLRQEDVLAKLDDDTFIVLLNDVSKPKFAGMVAEKILSTFTESFKQNSKSVNLSANIGVSIYPHDGLSLEEMIEKASSALFKAKKLGKNNYQYATEEMHVEALEYIQLDSALHKAMHSNELAIYYQPIYRIKTANICSVEGLMRWEHPVLGIVDPAKFILLAEESGLIIQIGEWALRETAQQLKYWQDKGFQHISAALKLSPRQFHHPEIATMISNTLSGIDINPKYIQLEITEKTIMEDVELTAQILKKIKATGVQISLDHFGTGYTSINYLKQFPISSIKIDKSFIKGLPNNPDDNAITSAMIALAQNLGLEVIAEGVESAEQIKFLLQQNCDMVQGYFLSHPATAQKMELLLRKLQDEVLL